MKVLVTGSVNWTDPALIDAALDECRRESQQMTVITGMANGADAIARDWATRNAVDLWCAPLERGEYPGPMHRYNERMLGWTPDVVIACKADLDMQRNRNAGTEHMCRIATDAGVRVQWLQAGDELS